MIDDRQTELDELAATARDHAEAVATRDPNGRIARRVAHDRVARLFADQLDALDGPTTTTPLTRSIVQED